MKHPRLVGVLLIVLGLAYFAAAKLLSDAVIVGAESDPVMWNIVGIVFIFVALVLGLVGASLLAFGDPVVEP